MKQILSTRFFRRCAVNPNYLSRYRFPDTKIFTKFKMYFITIQQGIRATQWIGFKRKQVRTPDIPKPQEKPPLQYRARQIVISLLSFSWQATFIIFYLSRCVFMLLPPARSSEGSCKGRFRIIRGWISVAGRKCSIFRNIFSTSWFFLCCLYYEDGFLRTYGKHFVWFVSERDVVKILNGCDKWM